MISIRAHKFDKDRHSLAHLLSHVLLQLQDLLVQLSDALISGLQFHDCLAALHVNYRKLHKNGMDTSSNKAPSHDIGQ